MKQFFIVWYGKTVVAQIIALIGTSEAAIKQTMIDDLWKVPGVLRVDGCTPGETESMIRWGVMKTYPLPTCDKPNCQTCKLTPA